MKEPEKENEDPPILGSWNKVYWLLVIALLIQILFYYYITLSFS